MTIAVEERARARPMRSAAVAPVPAASAMRPMTRVETTTCTQAEDQAAQGAQALPGQLDADGEEEEHDAELGDGGDLLRVRDREPGEPGVLAGEPAEPERADERAGPEEAEDGAHAQLMEERHHHACGREEEDRLLVGFDLNGAGHRVSSGPFMMSTGGGGGKRSPRCLCAHGCHGRVRPGHPGSAWG
jgi:hypothetical protein